MPKITLVEVPCLGASTVDYTSGTRLYLGESVEVDDATVAAIRSVESIPGYRFEVEGEVPAQQENAPAVAAGEPITDPAVPATPSAPYPAQ